VRKAQPKMLHHKGVISILLLYAGPIAFNAVVIVL